jgi:hypothetical protein
MIVPMVRGISVPRLLWLSQYEFSDKNVFRMRLIDAQVANRSSNYV